MKKLQYFVAVEGFEFVVKTIEITEELSRPWRAHAHFALDPQTMRGIPEEFDPDVVIKRDAAVILRRDVNNLNSGVEVRRMQGIVTSAELGASVSGVPMVDLVIEPRFSLLRHRQDVRSHRDLTAPQIVQEVAEALGVKVDTRLSGSYPVRPYCVQWRETDFDYCMRLMEDEGIFYYFAAGDVLVLGDAPSSYEDLPGNKVLAFHAAANLHAHQDAVHEFGSRAAMVPGKVTLRDWNTEHPSLDMDVQSGTKMPFGPEWYDYPGEYEEPSEGQRKARLHAEAFDRAAARYEGKTTCGRMYPGCTFELVSATLGIPPGGYVVRKMQVKWQRDEGQFSGDYSADFEADKADITYRPPRETHVPRIFNPHTGFVCTNGEDIQCDHFGRVKVQQHWDRLRPADDDCSHWIPVLQDNTGGSSAIPRKDWEVMVHFMEGDPDRPIVLGRVYNGEDKFQEFLPQSKHRSSLRSMTTPTREHSNEIRFQDLAGHEHIYVHACKDQNIRIANDQKKQTGTNEDQVIMHDETITIGGDCTWKIGDEFFPSVGNDQSWKVEGDRIVKLGSASSSAVGNDHEMKIKGDHKRKVYVEDNISTNNLKETVKGDLKEKFQALHSTMFGQKLDLLVKSGWNETIKGQKGETTTLKRVDKVTLNHNVFTRDVCQSRCDETRKMKVEGNLSAKVLKDTNLTGAKGFESKSNKSYYRGLKDVVMRVDKTEIVIKSGLVRFSAPNGNIYFAVSGPANHDAATSKQN